MDNQNLQIVTKLPAFNIKTPRLNANIRKCSIFDIKEKRGSVKPYYDPTHKESILFENPKNNHAIAKIKPLKKMHQRQFYQVYSGQAQSEMRGTKYSIGSSVHATSNYNHHAASEHQKQQSHMQKSDNRGIAIIQKYSNMINEYQNPPSSQKKSEQRSATVTNSIRAAGQGQLESSIMSAKNKNPRRLEHIQQKSVNSPKQELRYNWNPNQFINAQYMMAKTPNERPDLLPVITKAGKAFIATNSQSRLSHTENSEGEPSDQEHKFVQKKLKVKKRVKGKGGTNRLDQKCEKVYLRQNDLITTLIANTGQLKVFKQVRQQSETVPKRKLAKKQSIVRETIFSVPPEQMQRLDTEENYNSLHQSTFDENLEQGYEKPDQLTQMLNENPYGSNKGAATVIGGKKRSNNSMFNLTFTSTIPDGEHFATPVNQIMIAKTRKQSKKKISPQKEQQSLTYFETIEQQQKRMKKVRRRRGGNKVEDTQHKREKGWDQNLKLRSPQQSQSEIRQMNRKRESRVSKMGQMIPNQQGTQGLQGLQGMQETLAYKTFQTTNSPPRDNQMRYLPQGKSFMSPPTQQRNPKYSSIDNWGVKTKKILKADSKTERQIKNDYNQNLNNITKSGKKFLKIDSTSSVNSENEYNRVSGNIRIINQSDLGGSVTPLKTKTKLTANFRMALNADSGLAMNRKDSGTIANSGFENSPNRIKFEEQESIKLMDRSILAYHKPDEIMHLRASQGKTDSALDIYPTLEQKEIENYQNFRNKKYDSTRNFDEGSIEFAKQNADLPHEIFQSSNPLIEATFQNNTTVSQAKIGAEKTAQKEQQQSTREILKAKKLSQRLSDRKTSERKIKGILEFGSKLEKDFVKMNEDLGNLQMLKKKVTLMDKQRKIIEGKKGSGMLSIEELKILNDKPKGSVKFLMDENRS